MREPMIGDRIVYSTFKGFGIARVALVRERHLTCYPWKMGDRRWALGWQRIPRAQIVAVLDRATDHVALAETLNTLDHQHDAALANARKRHRAKVIKLAEARG